MIGEAVLGVYVVDKLLGEGGMGAVYRAVSPLGDEICVKVLHAQYAGRADIVERFTREATSARRVASPRIARVMAVDRTHAGQLYIAMEFVRGATLTRWMENRIPVTPADALPILAQIADGLQAAHRVDLVHRDIKPDNIMLRDDYGIERVTILDFGIAKDRRSGMQLTAEASMIGTPAYMAPEQAGAASTADATADVFALGVIAIELVTGRRPYAGPDDGIETIIARFTRIQHGIEAPPRVVDLALRPDGRRLDLPRAWLDTLDAAISVDKSRRPASVRALILPLCEALPNGRAILESLAPALASSYSPDDRTARAATNGAAGPATVSARHTVEPARGAPASSPGYPTSGPGYGSHPDGTVIAAGALRSHNDGTIAAAAGQRITGAPSPSRRGWVLTAVLAAAGVALGAVVVLTVTSGDGDIKARAAKPNDTSAAPVVTAPVVGAPPIDAAPPVDAGLLVDTAPSVDAALPIDAAPRVRRPPRNGSGSSRPPDGID